MRVSNRSLSLTRGNERDSRENVSRLNLTILFFLHSARIEFRNQLPLLGKKFFLGPDLRNQMKSQTDFARIEIRIEFVIFEKPKPAIHALMSENDCAGRIILGQAH